MEKSGILGQWVLTRTTIRTAEAMQIIEVEFKEKIDILVMVQGDEPLIKPETIRKNNL